MKLSEFWIDLPGALSDISSEILTPEEIDFANVILNSSKVSF